MTSPLIKVIKVCDLEVCYHLGEGNVIVDALSNGDLEDSDDTKIELCVELE